MSSENITIFSEKYCSCSEWKHSIDKVDNGERPSIKKGDSLFNFCPWCGRQLGEYFTQIYPPDGGWLHHTKDNIYIDWTEDRR